MKRIILSLSAALALSVFAVGIFGLNSAPASAAPAPPQCNGEMNGGGTQVACTVTIVNYIDAGGGLAGSPPSTLTMTRCVGASGPVGTLTCDTTVTTLSAPVTSVSQCNYAGEAAAEVFDACNSHHSPSASQPASAVPSSTRSSMVRCTRTAHPRNGGIT